MRSHWSIRGQLADLMVSLGLFKTALDNYLEIERWESVIACYTTLELKHKVSFQSSLHSIIIELINYLNPPGCRSDSKRIEEKRNG